MIPAVKDTGFFYGKINRYDRKKDFPKSYCENKKTNGSINTNEKNLHLLPKKMPA
jgi:hypothetical protein